MDPARIASLLAPFLAPDSLTDQQLAQVSTYLDLLLKWNARINLTSVRQLEEIITRHFGESFFTARHLFPGCHPERSLPEVRRTEALSAAEGVGPRNGPSAVEGSLPRPAAASLIDLGSGAGFPGLPIKLYAPGLSVTLIESNHKKATFLREVIRTLTLTQVDVFAKRAEDFPRTAGIVTLRAVEQPERALAAAARLVSPGGSLALLLGSASASSLPGLLSGFSWGRPLALPASTARVLMLGSASTDEPR